MSHFLEVVNLYRSSANLVVHVAKLQGLHEEGKKGSCEVKLMLKAPPSSGQIFMKELEKEKTSHYRGL